MVLQVCRTIRPYGYSYQTIWRCTRAFARDFCVRGAPWQPTICWVVICVVSKVPSEEHKDIQLLRRSGMVALGTICPFRNFPDVPKGPTKSCFWSAESDGRDGAEAKALMIYVPRAIF